MNGFWNKRRKIFGILILVCAFIVFFLGWTFNNEKMGRELSFGWDAITNFRRGLDISGGTKLTYRISYDTYEQTYTDAAELASVKKTVETIILKNIDNRISQLGVSDYKSYTQELNGDTEIVVEIGGVADLDYAKELIGKTVEIEFKLPNQDADTEENKAERMNIVQELYSDLIANPDKFEALAGGKDSENVFYNSYEKVSLAQLPKIYQDNIAVLNETAEGNFSPIMEGLYHTYQYQDYSGNMQTSNLSGYTFFRLVSKEQGVRSGVALNDIIEVATSLGATYDENFSIEKNETNIASGEYAFEGNVLKYNNGEISPLQTAYDVKILAVVDEEQTLSLTGTEINTDSASKLTEIQNSLLADEDAEIADASPVYEGILSEEDLKAAIPSFDVNNSSNVQIYDEDGFSYVVVIKDSKSASDKWYNFVIVNGLNEEEFNSALESQIFYTLEEVFVQDHLSWVNAQTSDGKILNGANFKYASIGTSQLGQPVVVISFDDTGKEAFCDITSNNIGTEMAIFIGGQLITSPTIQSKICDGSAQIDGNFTPDSAKELTNQLNDGALPAPLVLMQEEKVSATLGDNAFNGALIAMGIGFIVIFLYMSYLYGWKRGLISLISISVYTLVLLAIVKIIDYALSLSGIAAIILSIGMAVDANVLIFERMKEEKESGKSDNESINIAYDRSRSAIRDGQISTGMIGLLLMVMGINMFKGFGTMLVVAVILTLLINVPIIKELLHMFYRKK